MKRDDTVELIYECEREWVGRRVDRDAQLTTTIVQSSQGLHFGAIQ